MTELKACPFCGSDELSHGYDMTTASVQCHECDAFVTAPTEPEAITAWNTRHPTPAADEVEAVAVARAIAARNGATLREMRAANRNKYAELARAAIAAMQARSAEHAKFDPKAAAAEMRETARELREHGIRDCSTTYEAIMWEEKANALDPAEPVGEEPVAWMYINPRTGWRDVLTEKRSDDWVRYEQVTETPLYARPATPGNAERLVGWRPIDSAPKDGTEIILFGLYPENDEGLPTNRVTAGFWLEPEAPTIGDCGGECRCPEYGEAVPAHWCMMHGGSSSGWMSTDGGFTTEWPPTHWMPLPAAPLKEGQGE